MVIVIMMMDDNGADGDSNSYGDVTDGDAADGDATDGDATDGNATDSTLR